MLVWLAVAGVGHYVVKSKWVTAVGLVGAAIGAAQIVYILATQPSGEDAKIIPFPGATRVL